MTQDEGRRGGMGNSVHKRCQGLERSVRSSPLRLAEEWASAQEFQAVVNKTINAQVPERKIRARYGILTTPWPEYAARPTIPNGRPLLVGEVGANFCG
jgi:hypothetical protein